jgi:NADH:ubiquinone oxidoreductase subunit 6 (subunit J)
LTILSLILGTGFAGVIWHGTKDLVVVAPVSGPMPSDLGVMGRMLTQDNLLSLEVLALTLFLVLVGGGVVARFEGEDHS